MSKWNNGRIKLLRTRTKVYNGKKLYRIKALRNMGKVKKGQVGGYVEGIHNISREGTSWISLDSMVVDNAKIKDSALVGGNSVVSGEAIVGGNAFVTDSSVFGSVIISQNAYVESSSVLAGNVSISGDLSVRELRVTDGVFRGSGELTDDYLVIHNIGSENGTLTAYKLESGTVMVTRGCFFGTLEDFIKAVNKTHGVNRIGREYSYIIRLIESKFVRKRGL